MLTLLCPNIWLVSSRKSNCIFMKTIYDDILISNSIQDTWVVSKTCWMIKPLNMLLLSDHTVVTNKYVGKQCLIIAGKNSNWREN